jgi:hypothetical protein
MSHSSSELVQISKLNGDFKRNYGRLLGAYLYLRSISAVRGRSYVWPGCLLALASTMMNLVEALVPATRWVSGAKLRDALFRAGTLDRASRRHTLSASSPTGRHPSLNASAVPRMITRQSLCLHDLVCAVLRIGQHFAGARERAGPRRDQVHGRLRFEG